MREHLFRHSYGNARFVVAQAQHARAGRGDRLERGARRVERRLARELVNEDAESDAAGPVEAICPIVTSLTYSLTQEPDSSLTSARL